MSKNKLILAIVLILVTICTLLPFSFAENLETEPVSAANEIAEPHSATNPNATNDNEIVNQTAAQAAEESNSSVDTTKKGDQVLIGDTVVVDYVIDGNLYIIASNVTIKSQVIGNAFICAKNLTITEQGYISNSLYVASTNLEISGIAYDVYAASTNITISGYIYRDLHSTGTNVNLYGTIGRNASIISKNITFEKKEEKTSTTPESNAANPIQHGKVMGNLTYSAENENQFGKDYVEGTVVFHKYSENTSKINYAFVFLGLLIFNLVIWALLKWLAPKFLNRSSDLLLTKPIKTVGLGILSTVLIPILTIGCMFISMTSTIGLLLLFTYVVLLLVSELIFVIAVANSIAKKHNLTSNLKTILLIVGLTLVQFLIRFIPSAGSILNLALMVLGMGIITRSLVCKKENENS